MHIFASSTRTYTGTHANMRTTSFQTTVYIRLSFALVRASVFARDWVCVRASANFESPFIYLIDDDMSDIISHFFSVFFPDVFLFAI